MTAEAKARERRFSLYYPIGEREREREDGLGEGGGGTKTTHTPVSDLTGVATSGQVAPLGESNSNLAETLGSGARSDALVPGQGDLLGLAIRTLDLCGDGHDLVVEQARLLGGLGTLEAFGRVLVELLSGEVEVAADVFAGPAHGLHAILGLLAGGENVGVKGGLETIATKGHALGATCDANLD